MAEFDLSTLPPGEPYRVVSAVVVPRPIAWVTSRDETTGVVNAAPFSFFNVVGSSPMMIALGVSPSKRSGEGKDTRRNLHSVGVGFVVNLVDEASTAAMNATASELPAAESEAGATGLELAPTVKVAPVPRIASAPASLECVVSEIVTVQGNRVVLAEVVYVHIQDRLWDSEKRHFRAADAHMVGRLSGNLYARTNDQFTVERPL